LKGQRATPAAVHVQDRSATFQARGQISRLEITHPALFPSPLQPARAGPRAFPLTNLSPLLCTIPNATPPSDLTGYVSSFSDFSNTPRCGLTTVRRTFSRFSGPTPRSDFGVVLAVDLLSRFGTLQPPPSSSSPSHPFLV